MMKIPTDMKSFTELSPWWRTTVPTEIVLSGDGTAELLAKLKERGRRSFFIADGALRGSSLSSRRYSRKKIYSSLTRPFPNRVPATSIRCAR